MAVGDVVADTVDVVDSDYMTIQPAGTAAWVIHNITWSGQVSVQHYDGTRTCIFTTDTAAGGILGCVFHVTNTDYIRVLNTHASNHIVCHYDGKIEAV